jgi:hypothetical protein
MFTYREFLVTLWPKGQVEGQAGVRAAQINPERRAVAASLASRLKHYRTIPPAYINDDFNHSWVERR